MTQGVSALNVDRLMQVLSDILSDKHDARVTITAARKDPEDHDEGDAA